MLLGLSLQKMRGARVLELSLEVTDSSGPMGSRPGRTVVRKALEEARQQRCGRALVTWEGSGMAEKEGEGIGGRVRRRDELFLTLSWRAWL